MWLERLGASFEAAIAREEEAAAADLAFSLRQDVDAREAIARSGRGWTLVGLEGGMAALDEMGRDYVRAGAVLVPFERAVLRSGPGAPPGHDERTLAETLNAACRAGGTVLLSHDAGSVTGRLVRVAKDHVAVLSQAGETIVGLSAISSIRLEGYSASRGFSG